MTPKPPSVRSHLVALLMPITMILVIPWVILGGQIPTASPGLLAAGGVLAIAGLALFAATLRLFIAVGRGTLAPWNATRKLIVHGPYRYVRNPMIAAVMVILLAEAMALWSWPLLVWALAFFVLNTLYFALKEEPDLEQKFGADYRRYKQHVPRWVPRSTPYDG